MRPVAPPYAYAAVSLSNVVATTCQYEALKHLYFPLQTIAKCGKMLPVMLWGTLILSKTYTLKVRSRPAAGDAARSGVVQQRHVPLISKLTIGTMLSTHHLPS